MGLASHASKFSHQFPGQGGGLAQGPRLVVDLAGLPDAGDPEEAHRVVAVNLQPALIAGEDVIKAGRIGIGLGQDQDGLLARRHPGREIRVDTGIGAVEETFQLAADVAEISGGGQHQDVGLLDRGQHRGQIILQDAGVVLGLTAAATLAAFKIQVIQQKFGSLGPQFCGRLKEGSGQGVAVALGLGTSQHCDNLHGKISSSFWRWQEPRIPPQALAGAPDFQLFYHKIINF
jgi:hypothetical protein